MFSFNTNEVSVPYCIYHIVHCKMLLLPESGVNKWQGLQFLWNLWICSHKNFGFLAFVTSLSDRLLLTSQKNLLRPFSGCPLAVCFFQTDRICNVHGSVHHKNIPIYSNKLTNQMQQFYKFITWRFVSLNMFQAPPHPSSGAYNCINSLWCNLGAWW